MISKNLNKYNDFLEKHHKKIIEDFYTFLKFPSISADPKHKQDIQNCAKWLAGMYQKAGFEAQVWETKVHPVIFAEHKASSSRRPTILFYHHYDVQPVDPLELWNHPPFDPIQKGSEIFARGAADNKGQCYYTLVALQAFMELGKKEDINIKVLVDGEEEVGSEGLFQILEEKEKLLKSDYSLIVDLGVPSLDLPAVTIGFRGIITFDIECICSNTDLHSGQFGGISYNPLKGLTQVLSKIWDEDGHVQIPHFYDSLLEVDEKSSLMSIFRL